MKRLVSHRLYDESIGGYSVGDAIKLLQNLKCPPTASIIFQCGYVGDTYFNIVWQEEETDEEYQKRLVREHEQENERFVRDKAEWERLNVLFGSKQ